MTSPWSAMTTQTFASRGPDFDDGRLPRRESRAMHGHGSTRVGDWKSKIAGNGDPSFSRGAGITPEGLSHETAIVYDLCTVR